MEGNYLYIFVHVPKTGGTTLVKHIRKNFLAEEVLFLTFGKLGIYPDRGEAADWPKLAFDYVRKIPEAKRQKIKVIMGHIVPYGIHRFFPGEARYLTLVRDPRARIPSFYNYYRQLYENEDRRGRGRGKKLYQNLLLVGGRMPEFRQWYQEEYLLAKDNYLFQPQPEYFRTLGYFGGRSNLNKFFFVGITEKSSEDLAYLYHLLGIKKIFVDQNHSRRRAAGRPSVTATERNFYRLALETNRQFKRENSDFGPMVSRVRQQRAFLLPFTQIIFDFKETLRLIWIKMKHGIF